MLALCDQIGDQNVTAHKHCSIGVADGLGFRAQLGLADWTYVFVDKQLDPSSLDKSLSKLWAGWIDIRYGPKQLYNQADPMFSRRGVTKLQLDEIKKLRPNINVDYDH